MIKSMVSQIYIYILKLNCMKNIMFAATRLSLRSFNNRALINLTSISLMCRCTHAIYSSIGCKVKAYNQFLSHPFWICTQKLSDQWLLRGISCHLCHLKYAEISVIDINAFVHIQSTIIHQHSDAHIYLFFLSIMKLGRILIKIENNQIDALTIVIPELVAFSHSTASMRSYEWNWKLCELFIKLW